MKKLLDHWTVLAHRLDSREPRERVLILLLSLALVWGLFDVFWLSDNEKRLQLIRATNTTQAAQVTDLTQRVQTYQGILRTKSDQALQVKRDQLLSELAGHQQQLSTQARQMVSPAFVLELLPKMLPKTSSLELLSLKNLKPEPLGGAQNAGPVNVAPVGEPVLWRHRVEVRMRGRYTDIVDYLVQLERLQSSLGWHQVLLTTDTSAGTAPAPYAISATLVISSLSMEAQWLEF